MFVFSRFWHWWTDTWRAPKRARILYGVMALAFGALALIAAMQEDTFVAVLACVGVAVTIGLAVFATRLSKLTDPPNAEQGDQWKTN
ncbi:MAG: hypothetical protein WEB04_05055 [Dehalococcoidia bacterium]